MLKLICLFHITNMNKRKKLILKNALITFLFSTLLLSIINSKNLLYTSCLVHYLPAVHINDDGQCRPNIHLKNKT